ncbi:5322_t:CDS:2 [Paraglomus brasilianum]|uniref:5322_t:CDS:1 n=1 Tax=Paraglomus brasilianum TaxID=144538 RepID=A0A9N9FNV0_9GLOM|nr:5322_t:CDS:2 [Paraglomus brasilianum]
MAGYELPEDFIRDFRRWCECANYDPATLNAINALTNNQIRAIDVARFRGRARTIRETAADGNLPARPLVPPHSVWDEDWITSGGQPTDLAPNPPNAGNNGNAVAPKVTRIGLEHPISTLIRKLEEIERRKAELMLGQYDPNSHPVTSHSRSKANTKDPYITNNTGMTETEVRNLVKSMMLSEQSQPVSQTISSKPQEIQITLSQDEFKKIIASLKGTIAKGQQTLKKPPGPGNKKRMILLWTSVAKLVIILATALKIKKRASLDVLTKADPRKKKSSPKKRTSQKKSEPVPDIPDSDEEEETLDDPMEIDFVQRKEPATNLATISCKIKRLKIPALVLDSGAEPPENNKKLYLLL